MEHILSFTLTAAGCLQTVFSASYSKEAALFTLKLPSVQQCTFGVRKRRDTGRNCRQNLRCVRLIISDRFRTNTGPR